MLKCCARLAIVLGLIALPALFALSSREAPPPAGPARLAVLVYFDQLPNDYLTGPWGEHFGAGGFRRLEQEGAWYQNCHYPYATTVTGAGHASVAAGCSPEAHGIVGNDWYDHDDPTGRKVYCVEDEPRKRVPPAAQKPGADVPGQAEKAPKGVSPKLLLAPTVADALLEATGNRARVVALSLKDRSAVLPGGKNEAVACYWFDTADGMFVTSDYYRDRPHDFVRRFNAEKPRFADRWRGKKWEPLRTGLDYEVLGIDASPDGKGSGPPKLPKALRSKEFPHPFGGEAQADEAYYEAVSAAPAGNDLLLELTRRAVISEGLGSRDVPDLLCVSFSSNDLIGHPWGPNSPEVLDVTLRSDLIVRDLLALLDERVGRGRYLLVLTADHAICPLPEVSRKRGTPAYRIDGKALLKAANKFITAKFCRGEEGNYVAAFEFPWFYLNHKLLNGKKVSPAEAAEGLAGWLSEQDAHPGIGAAYTRAQMTGAGTLDRVGEILRRSFDPRRCGDVALVTRPYSIVYGTTGTTHGSPHPYDTHVPLLVYGPGVKPGVRGEPVPPQSAAAILAHALGIKAPAKCDAPVPEGLFEK